MNVLFFNDCTGVGGGETWVVQAAQKLQVRGHKIYIGCPTGAWLQKQAEKYRMGCFTYLLEECFVPQLIWAVREFVQEKEIDVIFCTLLGHRNEAKILTAALREAGRGIIILKMGLPVWHGVTPEHLGYGMEDCVKKITVLSHIIRTSILERMPKICADSIYVCYDGVDLSTYDSNKYNKIDRAQVRDELSIDINNTVLATVARLDPAKGHSYLLEAAVRIIQEHPNVIFIIAGEGSERSTLEKMAFSLGISEYIIFLGFVDDVARLLSAADLIVHPSLEEGLGIALMEAMSMSKPVVTTNVGGIPELVIHGETGLMVPPMDNERLTESTLQLLKDKDRMKAMGAAGRKRVEAHFNRDMQIEILEDFLQGEVDEATKVKRKPRFVSMSELDLSTEAPDFIFRKSWPRF